MGADITGGVLLNYFDNSRNIDTGCDKVANADVYPAAGSSVSTSYTNVNLDKFEVDGDHIVVSMWQYYPTTAGANTATPDGTYADDTAFITDDAFRTAAQDAEDAGTAGVFTGAARHYRIDYATDEETSCTVTKEDGATTYSFAHKWTTCTTFDCSASVAEDVAGDKSIILGSDEYAFETQDRSGTILFKGARTISYETIDGQGEPTDNFVISLDGYADDLEAAVGPCFEGTYQDIVSVTPDYTAANIGWTSGSSFELGLPAKLNYFLQNSKKQTDGTSDSTFKFPPVYKKMWGDST